MTEGRSVGVGVGLIMGGRRVFVGVGGGTGVFVEVGGGFGVFVGAGVFVAGTGVFVGGGTGVDVADKHCTVKGCKVQKALLLDAALMLERAALACVWHKAHGPSRNALLPRLRPLPVRR